MLRLDQKVAVVPVLSKSPANPLSHTLGTMAARGILENPALFAGYNTTPWECIENYVDLALSYGTNAFIFHHHLMYMFERTMSNAGKSHSKKHSTVNPLPLFAFSDVLKLDLHTSLTLYNRAKNIQLFDNCAVNSGLSGR